ncbi:MAG: hypothetical protein Q9175_000807 [Cornicularia normoerica]
MDKIGEQIPDHRFDGDGHAAKLARALAHGQRTCAPREKSEAFKTEDMMWLQLGNMAIDSVEDTSAHWVRHAGFDKAWER